MLATEHGPPVLTLRLAAFLEVRGFEATIIDSDAEHGNPEHDFLSDMFERDSDLRQRIRRGEFFAIFAAPPCSTAHATGGPHATASRPRARAATGKQDL